MRKSLTLYITFFLFHLTSFADNPRLEFVKNKGQWQGPFEYKSITGTGDVFLQAGAITYLIGEPGLWEKVDDSRHGRLKGPVTVKYHVYRMIFENALQPQITESKVQSHYYNYFLGNDSSRWKTGIHPCMALDYKGLYNGIDMHLASEAGNLKYDFMVQPGADVRQIVLRFEGAQKIRLKDGDLVITTSVGDVKELKPVAYQYINDQRTEVPCRYKLKDGKVTYDFPKDYDHKALLIIDPTVIFCTFTGSTADNWGFTATYDSDGNLYGGGNVSGLGFPADTGAYQTTYKGGTSTSGSGFPCDMAIIKYNSTGTTKIYGTYIGGSDNDQPHSMIVDANGDLIIAGRTYSSDYPVTSGAYDQTYNGGADLVITKLNPTAKALVGSTFVGGSGDDCVNFDADELAYGNLKHNYGDDSRSEVLIDDAGDIYVAASTHSSDFPTLNAIQGTIGGGQDGILVKMAPDLKTMLMGTFLGGTSDDAAYVLGLNKAQNSIYVGGGTMSADFPVTTGTFSPTYQGGIDGYVLRIRNGPAYTIQRGSFIGQANMDQVYGVQLDESDNVYLMGQTLGGGFPTTSGVYSNPASSQFVIKLDQNLTTNIYSTVFGTSNPTQTDISPVAFLVDTCENVYISGWGGHLSIPTMPATVGTTTGLPVTPGALQTTTDGADFYFIVLSKNAASLLYATFFGRSSTDPGKGEHVDGGTSRFDKDGIIYQAICGGCAGGFGTATPFPTTPGSWSPTNKSSNCNLATLKMGFELGKVEAEIGPEAKGCPPLTVNFTNTSVNGLSWDWDFGDGGTSASKTPTHTFFDAGTYTVRLIASNPNACLIQIDTAYLTIIVDSNSVDADFTYLVNDSCNKPYTVTFTNQTRTSPKNPSPQYFWDFGDATTFNGANPPPHSYNSTGVYTVRLIVVDTSACNSPDTMQQVVTIQNSFVVADATLPDASCFSASGIYFSVNGAGYTSVLWDFGDGNTSSSPNVTHVFDTGTYEVVLIVTNTNACNFSDTFKKTITIKPGPVANFTFKPTVPEPNDSIHYFNSSLYALSYQWFFGDGTGSYVDNPVHFFKKTGWYETCLIANGYEGCADTICKRVYADIYPAVDVPTGFTPNGDGKNDMVYVRGAAIEKLDYFRIFNRWGQLVFETQNIEIGWDGSFEGKQQPVDSYAYVLEVTFVDGTKANKKGNITLLR